MKILATLPAKGRDLRLDLFRGVANWGIFLDHIPNNIVNWVTTRNYGFSDAADLFIFISGYTVAFVFARMMLERGFIIGASRLLKRVWQIYVAHVFLFVLTSPKSDMSRRGMVTPVSPMTSTSGASWQIRRSSCSRG
jgi:hypothetical protein